MLITITQAIRRHATTRATFLTAVNNGQLTRHDHGDKLLVDTDELDAMFAPAPTTPTQAPDERNAVPLEMPDAVEEVQLRFPTPDELDAAVARALS